MFHRKIVRIKLWQDIQYKLMVIAQQAKGQTARCVEVVVIEITTSISYIHLILR